MDTDQKVATGASEDYDHSKTTLSDVANETEAGASMIETTACEKQDEKSVGLLSASENCSSLIKKCENESTSWATAEDTKTNCGETNGSPNDSSQQNLRNTGSPEPSCSICLGKMENKSFTNSCFHQFCFACLLEWSKVKPECPLCKQPFKSIVHNVRSMEDYDQYHLRFEDLNHWENPLGRRFRYRSTLTAERRRELTLGRFVVGRRMTSRTVSQPRSNGGHMSTTSDYRRHIYESGLQVLVQPATRSSRYREASPAFYTQNPACTHRLIPWLNRELNALEYGHQVAFLMELILSLIQRFHIQSPEFRELVQPYFLGRTNHFIHEFYNFARSPHDMTEYDRHISYDNNFSLVAEDTDSDSDVIVLSPEATSRPRWSRRALQSSPRTLSTSRNNVEVLNRAREFLDRVTTLGSWSLDTLPPSTSNIATTSMPSTSASPEPGPSGLQSASRSRNFPRLRSVITVPTPRAQEVKMELTVAEENEDDDCMIIGYEEPFAQHKPLDVIVLSDSDDDVILETPMPTAAAPEQSSSEDSAHQSTVTLPVPQEYETISQEVDRRCRSSSTTRYTSQSPSPVRKRKGSKHHKRSRTRLSPSDQSNSSSSHHRDKRSHKKHSSKSSDRSKSPSSRQDRESSERSHSHRKSSKKKHSRKHKSSKSRKDHQTSTP